MSIEELKQIEDRLDALEARMDIIEKLNKPNFKTETEKKPLSINYVAKMAGFSRSVIEQDIKKGNLEFVPRGKRKLIPAKSAEKYILFK